MRIVIRVPNGGGIGNYFNSLSNALPAPNDEMDARFRALKAETLKKEFGGDGIFFNGPRRWVANSLTASSWDDPGSRNQEVQP